MAEEDSGRSFYVNWPVMYIYAGRFGKVIDNLEARGCISKDLALEAKKTITELQNLIDVVTVTHDKEKQDRAEDLFHVIMITLFKALDNCFDKQFGSEVN